MSNFNYCPIVWMFTSKNPHAGNDDIKWKKKMRGTEKILYFVLNDCQWHYYYLLNKSEVAVMKLFPNKYKSGKLAWMAEGRRPVNLIIFVWFWIYNHTIEWPDLLAGQPLSLTIFIVTTHRKQKWPDSSISTYQTITLYFTLKINVWKKQTLLVLREEYIAETILQNSFNLCVI